MNGLRFWGARIPQYWHEQIFVAHLFTHPDYGQVGVSKTWGKLLACPGLIGPAEA